MIEQLMHVNVAQLRRLWTNKKLTKTEIARQLAITERSLDILAKQHRLPSRGRKHRAFSMAAPTPEDEAASAASLEIAPALREACELAKQRHFAQRRAEKYVPVNS